MKKSNAEIRGAKTRALPRLFDLPQPKAWLRGNGAMVLRLAYEFMYQDVQNTDLWIMEAMAWPE